MELPSLLPTSPLSYARSSSNPHSAYLPLWPMETAGLVIGGLGLAALFDTCMSAFEYIDTGRNYGKD